MKLNYRTKSAFNMFTRCDEKHSRKFTGGSRKHSCGLPTAFDPKNSKVVTQVIMLYSHLVPEHGARVRFSPGTSVNTLFSEYAHQKLGTGTLGTWSTSV